MKTTFKTISDLVSFLMELKDFDLHFNLISLIKTSQTYSIESNQDILLQLNLFNFYFYPNGVISIEVDL